MTTAWLKPSLENEHLACHAAVLLKSYTRWTGVSLIDPAHPVREQARQLFYAPFAVLSHNADPDPIFNYGNQTALLLFELSWEELIGLPSRTSAEPVHRGERERLLTTVARQGYIDDYRGVRITNSGRRFLIERATVWNLLGEDGAFSGQAAMFGEWTFLK
jgi:hypothetical protein